MANVTSLLEYAQMLQDKEEYEKAFEVLKNSFEENKDNAEYLEKTALAAKIVNSEDDARFYLEELIKVDPSNIMAYSELQDLYYNSDRYKYYLTRAKVKVLNNNPSQAVSDYKKAISSTPDENEKSEAEFLLAKTLEFLGKFQDAADLFLKHARKNHSADSFIKTSELLVRTGDDFAALSILKEASEVLSDNTEVKDLCAGLALKNDELEVAEKFAVSELLKAKISLMKNENDKAYEMLSNFNDKENPECIKLFAEYFFNIGDFEKASEYVDKFAQKAPNEPVTYQMKSMIAGALNNKEDELVNLAKMYIIRGNNEKAFHELLAAHAANPKNTETINLIIGICEETGERHTAVEFYEKLTKIEPTNISAFIAIGDFYYDIGEYYTASEYYKKAEDISADKDVLFKSGKCYEKMNRIKAACEYYQRFLDKAPLGTEAELVKNRLEKLKGSADGENYSDEGFIDKIMSFFSKRK